MVYTLLRDPQALSSTLVSLRMLQPQAFGSLKMHRDLGQARSLTIIMPKSQRHNFMINFIMQGLTAIMDRITAQIFMDRTRDI